MRSTKWMLYTKKAEFKEIAAKFNIDQVTARIIRNRDVIGDENIDIFLNGGLDRLHDPGLMKGINEALPILKEKIEKQKKIRIIGDYDADGVSSTFILLSVLEKLGAVVDYDIPERTLDGYGLNMRLVDQAAKDGVDTILTCDNGISALEQTKAAIEHGMTVIITDHHQPVLKDDEDVNSFILPEADAVINPAIPGETYPYPTVCGAVVAWKLMQALVSYLKNDPEKGELSVAAGIDPLHDLLPYAALATVTDVMDLTGENRIIVRHGLRTIEKTTDIGLRALINQTGLEGKTITGYHIGFVIGPCINASGRLDTAKRAIELLRCHDKTEAAKIAEELVTLNNERKEMTEEAVSEAILEIEGSDIRDDKVCVVYLPGCHESLAGIVAGKIRERYYKPTIVLTDSQKEGILKGSGRSIECYHMYRHLRVCRSLLEGFGGHPMAAGLQVRKENLDALRKMLNETSGLSDEDLIEKVMIDVPVPMYYLSERLINEIDLIGPFGKGNEKPKFALKNVTLRWGKIVGASNNVFKCKIIEKGGISKDGVWFGDTQEFLDHFAKIRGEQAVEDLMGRKGVVASVIYSPDIDDYQGRRSIQIKIQEIC